MNSVFLELAVIFAQLLANGLFSMAAIAISSSPLKDLPSRQL